MVRAFLFLIKSNQINQTAMKTSRGGKRPGAGRKAGAATKKTQEIANLAAHRGITPLEVMLEAMQWAYDNGGPVAAFNYAKDAAPYMHSKMASIEHSGKDGGAIEHSLDMSGEQLEMLAGKVAPLMLTLDREY